MGTVIQALEQTVITAEVHSPTGVENLVTTEVHGPAPVEAAVSAEI